MALPLHGRRRLLVTDDASLMRTASEALVPDASDDAMAFARRIVAHVLAAGDDVDDGGRVFPHLMMRRNPKGALPISALHIAPALEAFAKGAGTFQVARLDPESAHVGLTTALGGARPPDARDARDTAEAFFLLFEGGIACYALASEGDGLWLDWYGATMNAGLVVHDARRIGIVGFATPGKPALRRRRPLLPEDDATTEPAAIEAAANLWMDHSVGHEVHFESRRLDPERAHGLSPRDLADALVQELGHRALDAAWREIDAAQAEAILAALMHCDLVYDRDENRSLADATVLAQQLVAQLGPATSWLTNATWSPAHDRSGLRMGGWSPVLKTVFDAGVVCLSPERVTFLWAGSDD
jgi:hypothetical protein